jgi:hypothetical protein
MIDYQTVNYRLAMGAVYSELGVTIIDFNRGVVNGQTFHNGHLIIAHQGLKNWRK